jgi:pimeloyl-ACP methyl ester carboxylesterase
MAVRMRANRTLEGYMGQLLAVRAWKGTRDRLDTIDVPTLVIHGEHDRLIPPDNGRILARAIPGARLAMLADAAHIFLTDKFEPSREAVVTFLEAL